jgi:hypothetical protein
MFISSTLIFAPRHARVFRKDEGGFFHITSPPFCAMMILQVAIM